MAGAARLSVIVLADRYATIRSVVEHLRAQSIAHEIELVVACPFPNGFDLPSGPNGLAAVKLVEFPLLPMGLARAAAVRAASAPVVVLGETHAFPGPGWGEQLVRAHEGPWDAVAPGLENANPASARSWSGFLMDYGRWLAELPGGEIAEPPSYNASWKRDALLARPDLEQSLDPGALSLTQRGARYFHVPAARVAHVNVARPGAWAAERYFGGRLFAADRSRGWPLIRRLVYFGGSGLIPLIRLGRTHPAAASAGRHTRLPRGTLTAVAVGSVLWALGEAVGYVAGAGRAEARMAEYELHKERYA